MMRQKAAGRRAYLLHGWRPCPTCGGKGSITSDGWRAMSRKGGIAAVEASKNPDQMSMAERGRRGGAAMLPRFVNGRVVVHPEREPWRT